MTFLQKRVACTVSKLWDFYLFHWLLLGFRTLPNLCKQKRGPGLNFNNRPDSNTDCKAPECTTKSITADFPLAGLSSVVNEFIIQILFFLTLCKQGINLLALLVEKKPIPNSILSLFPLSLIEINQPATVYFMT